MDKQKVIETIERIFENNLDLIKYSDELTEDEVDWALKSLKIEAREVQS